MAHPLALFFVCAVIVLVAVFACWTFIPSLRDKMKGYSTITESAIMILTGLLGNVTGAISDAQAAGYFPPQLVAYLPIVFCLYFLLKRLGTSTPVGEK